MQVPGAIGVMFNPLTVQIEGVKEVNVTFSPAASVVAFEAKAPEPEAFVAGAAKVITWRTTPDL
ncbi:unannotated protein [freshwater metagenome]|uniref:Unannotated protein n=1 Tax=freshwater metagenome TaxID=449393 RepID=A0A6J6SWS4_9ZZZZ